MRKRNFLLALTSGSVVAPIAIAVACGTGGATTTPQYPLNSTNIVKLNDEASIDAVLQAEIDTEITTSTSAAALIKNAINVAATLYEPWNGITLTSILRNSKPSDLTPAAQTVFLTDLLANAVRIIWDVPLASNRDLITAWERMLGWTPAVLITKLSAAFSNYDGMGANATNSWPDFLFWWTLFIAPGTTQIALAPNLKALLINPSLVSEKDLRDFDAVLIGGAGRALPISRPGGAVLGLGARRSIWTGPVTNTPKYSSRATSLVKPSSDAIAIASISQAPLELALQDANSLVRDVIEKYKKTDPGLANTNISAIMATRSPKIMEATLPEMRARMLATALAKAWSLRDFQVEAVLSLLTRYLNVPTLQLSQRINNSYVNFDERSSVANESWANYVFYWRLAFAQASTGATPYEVLKAIIINGGVLTEAQFSELDRVAITPLNEPITLPNFATPFLGLGSQTSLFGQPIKITAQSVRYSIRNSAVTKRAEAAAREAIVAAPPTGDNAASIVRRVVLTVTSNANLQTTIATPPGALDKNQNAFTTPLFREIFTALWSIPLTNNVAPVIMTRLAAAMQLSASDFTSALKQTISNYDGEGSDAYRDWSSLLYYVELVLDPTPRASYDFEALKAVMTTGGVITTAKLLNANAVAIGTANQPTKVVDANNAPVSGLGAPATNTIFARRYGNRQYRVSQNANFTYKTETEARTEIGTASPLAAVARSPLATIISTMVASVKERVPATSGKTVPTILAENTPSDFTINNSNELILGVLPYVLAQIWELPDLSANQILGTLFRSTNSLDVTQFINKVIFVLVNFDERDSYGADSWSSLLNFFRLLSSPADNFSSLKAIMLNSGVFQEAELRRIDRVFTTAYGKAATDASGNPILFANNMPITGLGGQRSIFNAGYDPLPTTRYSLLNAPQPLFLEYNAIVRIANAPVAAGTPPTTVEGLLKSGVITALTKASTPIDAPTLLAYLVGGTPQTHFSDDTFFATWLTDTFVTQIRRVWQLPADITNAAIITGYTSASLSVPTGLQSLDLQRHLVTLFDNYNALGGQALASWSNLLQFLAYLTSSTNNNEAFKAIALNGNTYSEMQLRNINSVMTAIRDEPSNIKYKNEFITGLGGQNSLFPSDERAFRKPI